MNFSEVDEHYMRQALAEAQLAREAGEVPTGAVIVWRAPDAPAMCPARIIGRAHNQVEMLNDPTAHAEMLAITQAAAAVGDWRLVHATLYVTKEPCAMCAGALVLARISRVVFGCSDAKRGGMSRFGILQSEDLIHRCKVEEGLLLQDCRDMLCSFFQERRAEARKRPSGAFVNPN